MWVEAKRRRLTRQCRTGNDTGQLCAKKCLITPTISLHLLIRLMNRHLWLLAICQGLFLTNNVTLIAINGLVGLSLAPLGWMATLPVMGYVVGGAFSTSLVARSQSRWG